MSLGRAQLSITAETKYVVKRKTNWHAAGYSLLHTISLQMLSI
jgi:hypothetical protein